MKELLRRTLERILGSKSSEGALKKSNSARKPKGTAAKSARPRRKPAKKRETLPREQVLKILREDGFRDEIHYLSLRQPWAWLVLQGFKDVENRPTVSHFRGELFIHASSNRQRLEEKLEEVSDDFGIKVPIEDLKFGCLLGSVLMVDCVKKHESRWFEGPHGYVVCEPRWIKPIKLKANAAMQRTYNVQINYLNPKDSPAP